MLNSPVLQWGIGFIDKIDLQDCKQVLDIGCRQGHLSRYLARRYRHTDFIAVDNLETEIACANEYPLSNIQFETTDALSLQRKEYFDAVVSFSCLHWIQNKLKILQNIHTSLKIGGKAYLQFFATHDRDKNDRFLYQAAYSSKWKQYFKQFKPGYSEITITELCALLQNIGFIIHKIEFVTYETLFEHLDQLNNWFESWASHKDRIPKRKQKHFLHEVSQLYLKHYNHPENNFPYYEHLVEVICEKNMETNISHDKIVHQYGPVILTPKEIAVLKHFLQGKSAKEISEIILVSSKAVEFHLANIKNKLNCHRRSEIFQAAITYGFIHLIFH